MATSYQTIEGGRKKEKLAATAGGTANANAIPALNAAGQLDLTMMPPGIGPDVDTLPAAEAIAAGAFVNITATGTVRNAAASGIGTRAHGYVLAAATAAGQQVAVYFDDNNTSVTNATIGDQWLSATTPGASTTTPPTGVGVISQRVGVAVSSSVIHVAIDEPVILAQ